MKKIFLTQLFIAFFVLSGCTENNISEPETKLTKPYLNTIKENIPVCCLANDPLSGACNVIGNVSYVHQILSGPANERGVYVIQINLEMNTELCDLLGMVHPAWSVTGNSEDIVYVSEEGIVILEKNYQICNRSDIRLHVQYLITTNGLGIAALSIESIFTSFDMPG
ncbi:MAG: hypothetical protein R6W68_16275 [Ignavibacteriaceae bacterium]